MLELLCSPFLATFQSFIKGVETSCLICSPYISPGPVKRLLEEVERKQIQDSVAVKVVTDISAGNLLAGSTDIEALLLLTERIRNVRITYLPRIHAKVYVAEESLAIVGSANFTEAGSLANLEYGVALTDPAWVRTIRSDVERYAELGGIVDSRQLARLRSRVGELRDAVKEEQKSINQKVSSLSAELRRNTEEELIRVRVRGRTVNAIFADTLLYLLSRCPMSTVELHTYVHDIHPDLCDDAVDRVIDSEHYGKLWKHQVRNAQQHLKRGGLIRYNSRLRTWERTT